MKKFIILVILLAIASTAATTQAEPCIEDIEFNVKTQTIDLTIANLELGKTYEVYNVNQTDWVYSVTFQAVSPTVTIQIDPKSNQAAFKVRKIKNALITLTTLLIA